MQFQGRVWLFHGQNTKDGLEKKIKIQTTSKLQFWNKLVKTFFLTNFQKIDFFLSCIGIGDLYSKWLLNKVIIIIIIIVIIIIINIIIID